MRATAVARGAVSPELMPPRLRQSLALLCCPGCRGDVELSTDASALCCAVCAHRFGCDGGVPLLYWPGGGDERVADVVRAFYEHTPFPNYEDIDSPHTLRAKAEQGVFARRLDEAIPFGARVLEVGCGTGQLSNFLGLRAGRAVFGTDLCVGSLRLADGFRAAHDIPNVVFLQQNLFRPAFRPATFDVVIANGVLHHTGAPRLGLQSVLGLLKPGGLVVVGLYNTYGRFATRLRRLLFRASGNRFLFLDSRLRRHGLDGARRRAWLRDQYQHPEESTHTIGEVLGWFDELGVAFLRGVPACVPGERGLAREPLFAPCPRGTALDHGLVQLDMALRGGPEGGAFVMIGRKGADAGGAR